MNYFVLTDDDRLDCFYYGADRSIYQRVYEGKKWSRAVCVISDVRRHYSVMTDSEPILICQEKDGNIVMCHNKSGIWQSRTILESRSMEPPDMRMQRFKNMLIFDLLNDGEHILAAQCQNNGKWQKAVPIDKFVPFGNEIFRIIELKNGKCILIYRKNIPKQQIGFRIADSSCSIGEYKAVYTTNGIITDFSMVEYGGFFHFVLVVKNRFSCRLIYIKAAEEAAERHNTVLWEGSNMENAVIRAENDKIIIKCSMGRRCYTFINTEAGFKGLNTDRTTERMNKAYVAGRSGLGCNDLIVPADRPYDIDISVFGINK